jgi:hypothetical protein
MVFIAGFWIRRRHPKQKVEAEFEDRKADHVGDEAAEYAYAVPVTELDLARAHTTPELDARWNQIIEMPAGKR